MSKPGSEKILHLGVSELIRYLAGRLSNPEPMIKLEWELFAGVLLSRCVFSSNDSDIQLGVPVDPTEVPADPITGFTLADLLTRPTLRRDLDVDIVIIQSGTPFKFQVARVVRRDLGPGRKPFEDILSRKIERQQPDDKLFLAISVEENIAIAETQIASSLKPPLPFGGIFLLGKRNVAPGEFHCVSIYPVWREYDPIRLPFPL